MEWVFYLVMPLSAIVLGPVVRRRIVRRATLRRAAGEAVRIGAFLRGDRPPFPPRWRTGSLDTAAPRLVFRAWHRFGDPVPLSGLTLLRREGGRDLPSSAAPMTVFRMRDAGGGIVELGVVDDYAGLVEDVLRNAPPATAASPAARPPARRVPFWARLMAGLALPWAALCVVLYVGGEPVTARVLSNTGGGFCDVEWERGGRVHQAEVDCDDEDPDDPIRVLALPRPFDAGVVAAFLVPAIAVGVALVLAAPAGVYALVNARHRPAALPSGPAVVAEAEPPPRLEGWELRYSRIAETVERRALTEGWYDARPAGDRSPVDAGYLRRRVRSAAWWLLLPPFTAALTFEALLSLATFPDSPGRTARATVETVTTAVPLALYDLGVEYEVDGRTVEATVASTRRTGAGRSVLVRYDPADPSVARLAGSEDGTGRAARLLAVAFVLAAGMPSRTAWNARREIARLQRVRALRPETVRYALTRDAHGGMHALLATLDGDPRPGVAVPLGESPGIEVPVTGTAELRGTGGPVARPLLTVAGRELYAEAPAYDPDDQRLQALVNGDAVGEPGEG